MSALQATSHDNRGSNEFPFGFVYFNDDRRLAYAHDVTSATGGWPTVTRKHLQLAQQYLAARGIFLEVEE